MPAPSAPHSGPSVLLSACEECVPSIGLEFMRMEYRAAMKKHEVELYYLTMFYKRNKLRMDMYIMTAF